MASVQSAVERAAREQLITLAQQASLADAQIRVSVVPRAGAAAPCSRPVSIEPIDVRTLTRMRFAVVCDSIRTEYIARGSITARVVVATADIAANRPIAATEITREPRDVSATPDALSDLAAVTGQSSRRPIRTGQIISTRWLAEVLLVKRGAPVNIVARNAGIEVTVPGEALQPGHRNEIVRVKNVGNGKIITARVVGENTVEPVAE
jgi:flagella basal body P-ring formation protein FlgA